jgi:pyruvate dehydrogenase E1 component
MMETVDGEYQNCKAFGGAYTREHFFGKYPETAAMVANMSDDDIWRLNRGGHDPHKVYAAYDNAMKTVGQPTVILAKTVKGYGMGAAGEALNPPTRPRSSTTSAVRAFRDRFKHADRRRPVQGRQRAVLPPGREIPGAGIHARAPRQDGRLPAAAPPQGHAVAGGAAAGECSSAC